MLWSYIIACVIVAIIGFVFGYIGMVVGGQFSTRLVLKAREELASEFREKFAEQAKGGCNNGVEER